MMMAKLGQSIFVDIGDKKILIDAGAGNANVLLHNMDVCGISVTDIDLLVLSHGHLEHAGGLRPFLNVSTTLFPIKPLRSFAILQP